MAGRGVYETLKAYARLALTRRVCGLEPRRVPHAFPRAPSVRDDARIEEGAPLARVFGVELVTCSCSGGIAGAAGASEPSV